MNLDHGKPCPGSVFQLSPRGKFFSSCLYFYLPNGSICVKAAIKYCPRVCWPSCCLTSERKWAICGAVHRIHPLGPKEACLHRWTCTAHVWCTLPQSSIRARAKPQNNRLVRLQNKQESVQLKSRLARGRPQSPGLLWQVCEGSPWLPTAGCQCQDLPLY